MANNSSKEARIQALVVELLAEEAARDGLAGRPENINDIEDQMVQISNLFAREFGKQKLAQHTQPLPADPPCPDCGHAGQLQGEQTRELITSRGPVSLTEAKYHCPKCRRCFFPSECDVGA